MANEPASAVGGSDELPSDWLTKLKINIPGYRLLSVLGRGGQAVVFKAVQESTGQFVAVKLLRGGPITSPATRERFDREVRALATITHPNIVGIIDTGQTRHGHGFLVMRYIAGRSLQQMMDDQRFAGMGRDGPQPPPAVSSSPSPSKGEGRGEGVPAPSPFKGEGRGEGDSLQSRDREGAGTAPNTGLSASKSINNTARSPLPDGRGSEKRERVSEKQPAINHILQRDSQTRNDPAAMLILFKKICEAVSAAHAKGIVHRDLSPSNVIIDERNEPHIVDFGLARTAFDRFMQHNQRDITVTGQFLGKLAYASPEQAEGRREAIDARTDVYALGVILYQILTGGRFPYEVVGNIADVLKNIAHARPLPPSKLIRSASAHARYLATSQNNEPLQNSDDLQSRDRKGAGSAPDESRSKIPAPNNAERSPLPHGRGSDKPARPRKTHAPQPAEVNPIIEAIVLKALEKNPARRYAGAADFATDIDNYLAGHPTSVGIAPASQNQKRKRTIVAASVAALILVIGVVMNARFLLALVGISSSISLADPPSKPNIADSGGKETAGNGRTINLLSRVKLPNDSYDTSGTGKNCSGCWTRTIDGLQSDATEMTTVALGSPPSGDYEFRIEFTPLEGDGVIGQIMFYKGKKFVFFMNSFGRVTKGQTDPWHFQLWPDGRRPEVKFTEFMKPWSLVTNAERHVARVVVHDHDLSAYFDDEIVAEYKGSFQNLQNWGVGGGRKELGVITSRPTIIHSATVVSTSLTKQIPSMAKLFPVGSVWNVVDSHGSGTLKVTQTRGATATVEWTNNNGKWKWTVEFELKNGRICLRSCVGLSPGQTPNFVKFDNMDISGPTPIPGFLKLNLTGAWRVWHKTGNAWDRTTKTNNIEISRPG